MGCQGGAPANRHDQGSRHAEQQKGCKAFFYDHQRCAWQHGLSKPQRDTRQEGAPSRNNYKEFVRLLRKETVVYVCIHVHKPLSSNLVREARIFNGTEILVSRKHQQDAGLA